MLTRLWCRFHEILLQMDCLQFLIVSPGIEIKKTSLKSKLVDV